MTAVRETMMADKIEKILNSTLQHGDENKRIYLMKTAPQDVPEIIPKLHELAEKHAYEKIICKVPELCADDFIKHGYKKEAEIPAFYTDGEKALFLAKYPLARRENMTRQEKALVEEHILLAEKKARDGGELNKMTDKITGFRILKESDTGRLAELYKLVFESYPFPIFDKNYLIQTMRENIIYFGAFAGERLVAAASAEMDKTNKNVEMTDFATDPEFAGMNLALILLNELENEMSKLGIKTFYTIARSFSAAMNITFARAGYKFSGTLINNTNIFGRIEAMNIWYKIP